MKHGRKKVERGNKGRGNKGWGNKVRGNVGGGKASKRKVRIRKVKRGKVGQGKVEERPTQNQKEACRSFKIERFLDFSLLVKKLFHLSLKNFFHSTQPRFLLTNDHFFSSSQWVSFPHEWFVL